MRKLFAIALTTFREAVRNKVLYSIIFFAILLMMLAVVLGGASLNQDERFVRDIGLMATSLFSDIIAIFIGVTMVYQELERKTVYNVVSKPIGRATYFLGKFGGIALTLVAQLGLMILALLIVMALRGDPINGQLFAAFWLIFVEASLTAAIALFFSSFSTPYVSGFMTGGVWVVAHLVQELERYLPRIESLPARGLLTGVVNFVPDMNLFNITTQLTYGVAVPFSYVAQATTYGLAYAVACLAFGSLIFSRRDFL